MTLDEYFAGQDEARRLFGFLRRVIKTFDVVDMRVTKSQVAFYRRRAFAWVWVAWIEAANPGQTKGA